MFVARSFQQGFSVFSIVLLFSLSGCIGGGGGGGGGQVQFSGAGSEYAAQPGLQQVSASAAFGAGYSGRNIRVRVVDSGIDGRHSEFSGRVHAGGDWQSASDGRIDLYGHGTHVAAILAGAKDGVGMHGLLAGHSNKEIARAHGLSEVTIKHHLKSLRAKLGARNRTHAVCRAIELGIAEETLPAASRSSREKIIC